jgi:hypothetical protein
MSHFNNNTNSININNFDMISNNRLFSEFYSSFENEKLTDIDITGTETSSLIDIHFGILKLQAVPANISKNDIELVFVVDHSRSMCDKCSDGKTKMEHITHTLKNMFLYFHKIASNNLYFTIFIFDERFDSIMERKQIKKDEDIDLIIELINNIEPRGSTNIENALLKTCEYIQLVKNQYPETIFNNIFMTDGEATCGSKNNVALKSILTFNSNIYNYFIGFGLDHDARLLNFISNEKNSSYYFIDAIDKSGLVYGEILHDVLYTLLTDVQIVVENGSIYDYKNNIWVKKLYIGNINGESNKTYHLLSYSPNDCEVVINCKFDKEENNIIVNKLILDNTNHIKFIYRQKTLQLLYDINDYTNKSYEMKSQLKKQIIDLFNEIKNYININNVNNNVVEDNIFLKNLCDDLYISYRTLGSRYGAMYSCARQTSQGTQRCYTVSQTPDYMEHDLGINTLRHPRLQRNRNNYFDGSFNIDDVFVRIPGYDDNDDNQDNQDNQDILVHHMNDFDNSPYLTPMATQLMREISGMDTLSMQYDNKCLSMDDLEETQRY